MTIIFIHHLVYRAYKFNLFIFLKMQGAVVQSIVSLTNSLRCHLVKYLNDFITNYIDIFVERMKEAFALQKLLTFFQQKYWHISDIYV